MEHLTRRHPEGALVEARHASDRWGNSFARAGYLYLYHLLVLVVGDRTAGERVEYPNDDIAASLAADGSWIVTGLPAASQPQDEPVAEPPPAKPYKLKVKVPPFRLPDLEGAPLFEVPRPAGGSGPIYSETFFPRLHFGWSELTSVILEVRQKQLHAGRHHLQNSDITRQTNIIDCDRKCLFSGSRF